MASAAVNGIPAPPLTAESFLECCAAAASPAARGWLSPRISFGLDLDDQHAMDDNGLQALPRERSGVVGKGACDFEFRLEDSISMLPADELFSDGKLLPLYLAAIRPAVEQAAAAAAAAAGEVVDGEGEEGVVVQEISAPEEVVAAALPDPYLFSPKAPRCSTRWRELLRLKKAAVAAALSSKAENKAAADATATTTTTTSTCSASSSSASSNVRRLRFFLHRNPKSSAPSGSDPSLNLPLLQTSSESDPLPTSSRPSSPDRLDLPRLSLDSERPSHKQASSAACCSGTPPRPRSSYKCSSRSRALPDYSPARSGRSSSRRAPEEAAPRRGVSVDSPRMNPSGKIVFHGLERSSSSPGSFNGGPRPKHRPMERSYSANVRVAPVINLIGFGPLFSSSSSSSSCSSSQKKDAAGKSRGKAKGASAAAKGTS